MASYYGTLRGKGKLKARKTGNIGSGMEAVIQGRHGKITLRVFYSMKEHSSMFRVILEPPNAVPGPEQVLAEGELNGFKPVTAQVKL